MVLAQKRLPIGRVFHHEIVILGFVDFHVVANPYRINHRSQVLLQDTVPNVVIIESFIRKKMALE